MGEQDMTLELATMRVAVVGASLGGLSVANVLHSLGAQVQVYEAFGSEFHTRGGALGAVDVELLRQIRGDTERPRHIRGHGHFYGDLWEYLFEGLPEDTVSFGTTVHGIVDGDTRSPRLQVGDDPEHDLTDRFDMVIGADGGRSRIRQYVTNQTPSYSGYTVWRGLCPTSAVHGPPSGSATRDGFYYETLGFPTAGPGAETLWNCGIYMACPEAEVERP